MHIVRKFLRWYPTDTQFSVHSDLFYSFIIIFMALIDLGWPGRMTWTYDLDIWPERSFHQLQVDEIFEKRLKWQLFQERNQTVIWIRLLHHKSLKILCNTFSLHYHNLNIFDQENIEFVVRCLLSAVRFTRFRSGGNLTGSEVYQVTRKRKNLCSC